MIGMSTRPEKTRPLSYTLRNAIGSPAVRGAGVVPPSGDDRMFRALHGSNCAGSPQTCGTNGQPSCTMSAPDFQPPTLAFRSRNSAGVIAPERSDVRPYCTPTLSHGERAQPSGPTP